MEYCPLCRSVIADKKIGRTYDLTPRQVLEEKDIKETKGGLLILYSNEERVKQNEGLFSTALNGMLAAMSSLFGSSLYQVSILLLLVLFC